jgi:hypothetical protein
MPTPFDDYDKNEAKKKITTSANASVNKLFMEGDHWQDGDGWVGPAPQTGEDGYTETMSEIENAFVSRNVILEVVERHVGGVLGREPAWGLTPIEPVPEGEDLDESTQNDIDEAISFLQEWWDNKGIHEYLQDVASDSLWGERGNLRLYIPSGLRDGDEKVSAVDLVAALEYIYPDKPELEDCIVYEDEDTKLKIGILKYTTDEGQKEHFELVYLAEKTGEEKPDTIIRQLLADGTTLEYSFEFNGHITIAQIDRSPLITTQVQQGQKAINLAISMLPRNIVTGGFLERVLLNAQMPGEWELNPDGTRKRFVPSVLSIGAGTTNFFTGIDYEEQDPMTGKKRTVLATPSVNWRDPVDTKFASDAKRSHYEDILEEVEQAHILKQQHANATGLAIEQARADFLSSLRTTKSRVDRLGRWTIETALAMAEQILGSPGKWTSKYRATFACRIDPGPVSTDEKRANTDAADKQQLSRRTAMQLNGVADVDAELQLIASQEDSQLSMRQSQAEALKAFKDAGIDIVTAAKLIGLEGEELSLIEAAKKEAEEKAAEMKEALANSGVEGTGDQPGSPQEGVDEE